MLVNEVFEESDREIVNRRGYMSHSEPGNPKLKAAFLSPKTSFHFILFFSLQTHSFFF